MRDAEPSKWIRVQLQTGISWLLESLVTSGHSWLWPCHCAPELNWQNPRRVNGLIQLLSIKNRQETKRHLPPFGHIYYYQLWPLGPQQKAVEARDLAHRPMTFIVKAAPPLLLQKKFLVAMIFFSIGCADEALKLHKEVYEKRLVHQGTNNHLTLGSQYKLAVCYQNVNNLESAECCWSAPNLPSRANLTI